MHAWGYSSDPSTFNLYLLNKDKVPSVNLKIASNLTTSDDEYTFDGVDVLPGYVAFPRSNPPRPPSPFHFPPLIYSPSSAPDKQYEHKQPCSSPLTQIHSRSGYIFNLKDVSSNDILAQSEEFSVVAHGDNTTTSSAASTATATSSDGGSASNTDEPNAGTAVRAARLPVAGGVMGVVVGVACAFWGDI
jgi:hypothetical protein